MVAATHPAREPPSVPFAVTVPAIIRRHPLVSAALLLLVWTMVLRLPFAHIVDDDEAFFSVVATRWQHGELPYVASFDIKPPLLFLLYVIANLLTGGGLAAIKGLEVVMVAWGAWAIYRLVSRHGPQPAAVWAAGLYPIYSLALSGVYAPNLPIVAPFIIMACDYALRARQDGLRAVAIAGALCGCAGLVKQTAVFETLAILVFLFVSTPKGGRLRMLAIFVASAALAWVPFIVYFWLNGALRQAFDAVVLSAVTRLHGDVQLMPSGELRPVSEWNGLIYFLPCLKPVFALLWLAAVAALRYRKMGETWPQPLLQLCALWIAAASVDLFSMHGMAEMYAQDFVAPLLIVSGIVVTRGFAFARGTRAWWIAGYVVAAVAVPAFIDRNDLWLGVVKGRNDPKAIEAVAEAMKADGVKPGDRIFVPNRGLMIYVATRTMPTANVFHPLQLMCDFSTPDAHPLAQGLARRTDYLVVARTDLNMVCETPQHRTELNQAIARDYRPVKVVTGDWDTFTIYRRKT